MTCENCGTHKVGECNCLETLIVSVDNGASLKFVKMNYVELAKFGRTQARDEVELNVYPLDAVPFCTAEELEKGI